MLTLGAPKRRPPRRLGARPDHDQRLFQAIVI